MKKNISIIISILLFSVSCNSQPSPLDSVMNVLKRTDTASYKTLKKTVTYLKNSKKGRKYFKNIEGEFILIGKYIIKQNIEIKNLKTSDNKAVKEFCSDTTAQFFIKSFTVIDAVNEERNRAKLQLKITYNELTNYYILKNYFGNIPEIKNKIAIFKNTLLLSKTQKTMTNSLILNIEKSDLIEIEIMQDDIISTNPITVEKLEELKEIYVTPVQLKYINDYIKKIENE